MTAAPHGTTGSPIGLERVIFFSDAVFAIVITLLVLPLAADVDLPSEPASWASAVGDLRPQMVTFAIGFLVIGQFWMAHHSIFGQLGRYDHGLLWINLLLLLTVTFLPFPTAVLGAEARPGDNFPVVFYAVSLSLTSIAMSCTWLYAIRQKLVDTSLSAADVRAGTVRSLVTSAVFLVSIGVAFLGLVPAIVTWVVVHPIARTVGDRAFVKTDAASKG